MTPREWALHYLDMGYHPIPCRARTKFPLVEWRKYQQDAPTRLEVETWWKEQPNANIALVMGRGTFALDFDGGDAAELLVTNQGIELPPDAPKNRTGSGGAHVILAGHCSDRVGLFSTDGHKPQVDVRGVGIIVVPPSIHPNGTPYRWEVPLVSAPRLPKAPPLLVALISQAGAEQPAAAGAPPLDGPSSQSWVVEALRGVPEGQRDDTCARLAGYFLHKGLPTDIVEAVLLSGFAPRCKPPLPPRDVRKTVLSITRKEAVNGERDQVVTPEHIRALMLRVVADLQSDAQPKMCPTPFGALNQLLDGGFTPGELIYLGARPGVGKTALALDFARAASKTGNVLVISREMLNTSLGLRMLAQEGHIAASSLKRREFTPDEYQRLGATAGALAERRMWLTDRVVRLSEIADLMGKPPESGWSLVIVDYLQLIRAPNDIKDRRLQVEAVSQGLKTLAVQYEVPVLCLSSLSRPPQGNQEPSLASLRESGELEHDADVVILLHRPDDVSDAVKCKVAKARNGRLGPVDLIFQREYVSFQQLEQQTPERNWVA